MYFIYLVGFNIKVFMKQSAGILLYRQAETGLEFFLVHPGGPFFSRKQEGWWTIPKGEPEDGEELTTTALREFKEETGYTVTSDLIALLPVKQKGGKVVHCWAAVGDLDAENIISNVFEIEWPPRSGKMKSFPEIDKACWADLEMAMKLINEKQAAFLEELHTILSGHKKT